MAPLAGNQNHSNSMGSGPSSSSSANKDSKTSVQAPVQEYLTNRKSYYSCIYCRTHLADHDHLVSRSFQGNHGRAYLFEAVVNVTCGPAVQRELNTGSHAVADIFCTSCETTLGWKYEKAYVETQKYKEGKYIIELANVVRENRHLELDKSQMLLGVGGSKSRSSVRSFQQKQRHPPSNSNSMSPSSPNCLSSEDADDDEDDNQNQINNLERNQNQNLNLNQNQNDNLEDEDEELLFPFYDDLYVDRSSYSSSYFSLGQRNRLRRSVYQDSSPYDWKYYTASPSSSSSLSASFCVP